MDNSRQSIQQTDLSKLKWSSAYYTVPDLLKKFPLPQIVKVIGGFYGEDDKSTLSTNQVLYLHAVKSFEKVHGRDSKGKEISISQECKDRVEVRVRPSNMKDVYESVEELCSVFPNYVRISQGYYSPSTGEEILNVGDKLCLKRIEKSKKGKETLICINQNGQTIELPTDCEAGFQPLTDGKEYYLSEIIKFMRMPVYVQFVKPYSMGEQTRSEDESLCQPLGPVCLDRVYSEKAIIATSIRTNGKHIMMKFSHDTDIALVVCDTETRGSAEYAKICQSLSHDVEIENINTNIYEYIDVEQNLQEVILNFSSNSKKQKKKQSHSKTPSKPSPIAKTKSSATQHDAKFGGKLTNFMRRHNESKSCTHSKDAQSDVSEYKRFSDGAEQICSDPNAIYEEVGSSCTEFVNYSSIYTELDPTYITTNPHEYAKPQANSVAPAISDSDSQQTSDTKPKTSSNEPPVDSGLNLSSNSGEQSSAIPGGSKQPAAGAGSSSHPLENRRPPPVPDRPSYMPRISAVPESPLLSNNSIPLPDSLPPVPARKPAKPIVPDRVHAATNQFLLRSSKPTEAKDSIALPEIPPQLPKRPPNMPAMPDKAIPINNVTSITPQQQKEDIYEALSKYPTDLTSLSVGDVSRLLTYLGMESNVQLFAAELVDGDMLSSMDKQSLESLNMSAFHVKKLLKFIGGWRPNV